MKLAIFDLDGTLVDRTGAFADAITSLSHDHAYGPEIEQWLLTELADHAERRDFDRLRATFPVSESADHLWRVYIDRMAASMHCRPAVLDSLERLKQAGWSIGVATNGASDIQRAKIHATGLSDLIDGIAASGDIDIRKPDPRLFELAAARCGTQLTPGDWMTGDNPETDIAGGHDAGLRTIWVTGRPWPDGLVTPHHTVGDVVEAIDYLLDQDSA
ncbi:HAD family hydrolase [Streptomyces sp. NRRL B-24085]|uniref:HAD family hydrolase n=1 Tax=Streptomyces sp. NRRL B-24085 TaxID=1709476 RepID=UPI0006B3906B|nr:HAD family hydrolase [Streptomyces sp. NRRL B-24085]